MTWFLQATRPRHTIIVSPPPPTRRTRCLARSSNLIIIIISKTRPWTILPLLGTMLARKLINLRLPMELSSRKTAAGSEYKVISKAKVKDRRTRLFLDQAASSSQAVSRTREVSSRLRIHLLIALGLVLLLDPEASSTRHNLILWSWILLKICPTVNSNNRCSRLTSLRLVPTSATSSRRVYTIRLNKTGRWWSLWLSSRSRTVNQRSNPKTMVEQRTQARVRSHARESELTSVAVPYSNETTCQACRNRTLLLNRASNQTRPYSKDAETTRKLISRTRALRNILSTARSNSMIPRTIWQRSRPWMSLLSTGLWWIARKRLIIRQTSR